MQYKAQVVHAVHVAIEGFCVTLIVVQQWRGRKVGSFVIGSDSRCW